MFVAALGVPREVIDLCHSNNVLVVNMCGKVRHAIAAVEAGCDLVVAQGTEAGGHTGQVATMPLVPQIVDAVGDRVPVVAAGGHLRRPRPRGRARARCRRRLGRARASSPRPRRARRLATRTRCSRPREDGTVVSQAFIGQADARRAQRDHAALRRAPRGAASRSPSSSWSRPSSGVLHLPEGDDAKGVDPERECYPAGQGIGCDRRPRAGRRARAPLRRPKPKRALDRVELAHAPA